VKSADYISWLHELVTSVGYSSWLSDERLANPTATQPGNILNLPNRYEWSTVYYACCQPTIIGTEHRSAVSHLCSLTVLFALSVPDAETATHIRK